MGSKGGDRDRCTRWLSNHSALVIAVALVVVGVLLLLGPPIAHSTDLRLLLSGAAFGASLAELINDFHRAEDRRRQREKDRLEDDKDKARTAQHEHLVAQLRYRLKEMAVRLNEIPNTRPRQQAFRLGAFIAWLTLFKCAESESPFESREIIDIARRFGVLKWYEYIGTYTAETARQDVNASIAEIRRHLHGNHGGYIERGFQDGFRIQRMLSRCLVETTLPPATDIDFLKNVVGSSSIGEPFKTWALQNIEAMTTGQLKRANAPLLLRALLSMLSLSYYLYGDQDTEHRWSTSDANIPDAHSLTSQQLVNISPRRMVMSLVTRFPTLTMDVDGKSVIKLIPTTSAIYDDLV